MKSPHALLSAKRRKVRKQSEAIAKKLKASAHNGGVSSELHQLQKTLAVLRGDVRRSGGPDAQHVADALGHLDTSLGKLIEAQHTSKGVDELNALTEGMNAFVAARSAAKAAGHAWQL